MIRNILLLALFLAPFKLWAQNVDPTFGNLGIATTSFGATEYASSASALQPDGKLVVVGYSNSNYMITVSRYTTSGVLDPAFSGDGKFTTELLLATPIPPILKVSILSGNKILFLVSGFNVGFNLYRLTSSGALDPGFNDGTGYASFGQNYFSGTKVRNIRSMKVQQDGKIVLVGQCEKTTTLNQMLIARLQSNGTQLDNTFSSDGFAVRDLFSYGSDASEVIIQANGTLLVGGSTVSSPGEGRRFALVRYNSSGEPSNLPGTNFSGFSFGLGTFFGMVEQPDGKLLMVGYSSTIKIVVFRILTNGFREPSFGNQGNAEISWTTSPDEYNWSPRISLTNTGQILVSGGVGSSAQTFKVKLTRLTSDGNPDPTFGTQGTVSEPIFGAGFVQPCTQEYTSDNKLILVACKKNGTQFDEVVTRWFLKCTVFKTKSITLCGGESYFFNNQNITQAGTYSGTISNTACDSVVTLNVSAFPVVLPSVSITSTPFPVCAGSPITFAATVQNGGSNPVYTWKKNFNPVANTPTYSSSTLEDGDQISLSITSNRPCASPPTAASNFITVSINPYPVASITKTGDQLSCPFTVGAQYQWLDCNNGNANIPGAVYPDYMPSQSGSYAVRVTRNGCTSTSACFTYVFTSVEKPLTDTQDGTIWPNPAKDKISFRVPNPKGRETDFQILDGLGRTLLRGTVQGENPEIDVRSIAPGMYLLRSEGIHIQRFLKE